jgi:group I intron endonuclease
MKREKISGVYGLHNKINNKWYIGVSIDIFKRWITGYKRLNCKNQTKIYNALLKHGYDNFDKIILEKCEKSDFKMKESFWINQYDSVTVGYNMASGGEGGCRPIGIPCSEETKRKIGAANLGRKHSDDAKLKMSKMRKGISKPIGFGEKISSALTGSKLTEERKKNISKSLIGLKWSNERKLNVSINRSKQKHPRWKPLSKENQDFIRKYYLIESHNWIKNNMPQKITQKKLHKCITNLVNNPHMEVITDFI